MEKTFLYLLFISIFGLSISACRQTPKAAEEIPLSDTEKTEYLEKGKAIAAATFGELSTHLQAAMQEGGVSNAIQYCNLNAYDLVDSLSKVHDATIRRTSLKVRNPEDAPTPAERAVLEQYAEMEAEGQSLKPLVKTLENNQVAFFAPIRVNAFCLQCHGTPGETIKTEDYAVISGHYPNDQATGYSAGDLRGMWSIQFRNGKK